MDLLPLAARQISVIAATRDVTAGCRFIWGLNPRRQLQPLEWLILTSAIIGSAMKCCRVFRPHFTSFFGWSGKNSLEFTVQRKKKLCK